MLYSTTIPSSPTSPLYHVLEDPNTTDTNGKSALSAPSERPSDPLRSDSDYDEPVFRGVRPAIFPPPGARENEANYETMLRDLLTTLIKMLWKMTTNTAIVTLLLIKTKKTKRPKDLKQKGLLTVL